MKKKISVLGVPMWVGQTRYGTNMGPDALRQAGLLDRLEPLLLEVTDEGNVPVGTPELRKQLEDNMKNAKAVINANEKLAEKVSNIVAAQRFPLVLGGDHSIALGTLAGLAKHYDNLGVIWYDAHADMNTPETSPSGNIHGMPLAASMGLGPVGLTQIGGYIGKVKAENIVLIGARDIDPGEQELIARTGIRVYSADDVQRIGIDTVVQETLAYLAARCDGIHLSFDVDGIDPLEMPGVGTPVPQGISYRDSIRGLQTLFATDMVTSAEFVEVNPLLDKGDSSVQLTIDLIGALFGESRAGQMLNDVIVPTAQSAG